MLYKLSIIVILLLPLSGVAAKPDSQQQLDAVKTEIKLLNKDVNKNKTTKVELFKRLKEQSRSVSNLNKILMKLEKTISQKSVELTQLQQQLKQQNKSHSEQLTALNQQIRSSFIQGQPNFLKILLNQHDPATLSRSSTYFHYFHQARQRQLSHINDFLNNLTDDQIRVFAAQQKQQNLYAQQKQKKQALKKQMQQRKSTIALLDTKITDQGSRLNLLQEEEKSLRALLKSLKKPTRSYAVKALPTNLAFAKKAGKLSWPVKGKVLARYGSSRNVGKLTWQGILIAAPAGKDVLTPASGQVVFSDWLRGFGLLVIIDHGDQYMTLYGNNESLLRSVGDNVSAGDIIARSGDEGMRRHAGLYFEIRHKGNPANPLKWLSKKVS